MAKPPVTTALDMRLEQSMTLEERAALVAVNMAINNLAVTHPNVLTEDLELWRGVPKETLYPGLIRLKIHEILVEAVPDLERRQLLTAYILRRIKINGVPVLDWERDMTLMAKAVKATKEQT